MQCPLVELSDQADLQVHPSSPALAPAAAAALGEALRKLLVQFTREGRLRRWALDLQEGGHFLIIAWENASGEGMSGCSKDKMAKVLAHQEQRSGSNLQSPPPLWLVIDGVVSGCTPAGLRELVRAGKVDETTPAFDTAAMDLGSWRRSVRAPLAEIPYLARTLARIRQRLAGP